MAAVTLDQMQSGITFIMNTVLSKTIKDQDFALDPQTSYIKCRFVNSQLFYSGGDTQLVNCYLEKSQVTFTGDAAKVVQFMQSVGMVPPPQPPLAPESPESGITH